MVKKDVSGVDSVMCEVGVTKEGILYYPECPNASLEGVFIKDCLCATLSAGDFCHGFYWCSTAIKYDVCPMDVNTNV
jgi:hypothetical protein